MSNYIVRYWVSDSQYKYSDADHWLKLPLTGADLGAAAQRKLVGLYKAKDPKNYAHLIFHIKGILWAGESASSRETEND